MAAKRGCVHRRSSPLKVALILAPRKALPNEQNQVSNPATGWLLTQCGVSRGSRGSFCTLEGFLGPDGPYFSELASRNLASSLRQNCLGYKGCGRAIWEVELGANVALAVRDCACCLLRGGF